MNSVWSKELCSYAFMFFTVLQIFTAINFAFFSQGFFSYESGGLFQCSELLSTGSDDEVMMIVFIALIVPILIRLRHRKDRPTFIEICLYFTIVLVGLVISVFTVECGTKFDTMFMAYDLNLMFFFVFGICSLVAMTTFPKYDAPP